MTLGDKTIKEKTHRIVYANVICVQNELGEILLGQRHDRWGSFNNYWTLPGGSADPDDMHLPSVDGLSVALEDNDRHMRCAAIREYGEETGLWFLSQDSEEDPCVDKLAERSESARQYLGETHNAEVTHRKLLQLCSEMKVSLSTHRLQRSSLKDLPLGKNARLHLSVYSMRIDTQGKSQLLLKTCKPTCGEMRSLKWWDPNELMKARRDGKVLMVPSLVEHLLEEGLVFNIDPHEKELVIVSESESFASSAGPNWISRAYPTPTLPPATTTNSIFIGQQEFYVVDPASYNLEAQRDLINLIQKRVELGHKFSGVILTHLHQDHIGSVETVVKAYGVPVIAHESNLDRKQLPFRLDRGLRDIEKIILDDEEWLALHTPGHEPGHLCLWNAKRSILVAGDMVATNSSIVIAHPDGHASTYVKSMKRLIELQPYTVIPAHGRAMAGGTQRLVEQLEHREKRIAQIKEAAQNEGRNDLTVLAKNIYQDVWETAHKDLFVASVKAHL